MRTSATRVSGTMASGSVQLKIWACDGSASHLASSIPAAIFFSILAIRYQRPAPLATTRAKVIRVPTGVSLKDPAPAP